jgi:hypothetical protein
MSSTRVPGRRLEELYELEERVIDLTAAALAAELDSPPADPRLSARVLINAIEGLTHRLVLRRPPGVSPEAIAREITELARGYTDRLDRTHAPRYRSGVGRSAFELVPASSSNSD